TRLRIGFYFRSVEEWSQIPALKNGNYHKASTGTVKNSGRVFLMPVSNISLGTISQLLTQKPLYRLPEVKSHAELSSHPLKNVVSNSKKRGAHEHKLNETNAQCMSSRMTGLPGLNGVAANSARSTPTTASWKVIS